MSRSRHADLVRPKTALPSSPSNRLVQSLTPASLPTAPPTRSVTLAEPAIQSEDMTDWIAKIYIDTLIPTPSALPPSVMPCRVCTASVA